MPELPEVETVVRTLEIQLAQCTMTQVIVHTPAIVYHVENFAKSILNQKITHFKRRGKYIILGFQTHSLIIHLRMEGRFFFTQAHFTPNKHVHVSFILDDHRVLHYHDTRKFGRMLVTDECDAVLNHVGLEYTDPQFTVRYLFDAMQQSKRNVKGFLLSQHVICGLGNIYVDEVCFHAKVHPNTLAHVLPWDDVARIHSAIAIILDSAIAQGGSSIRTYSNAMGIDGRFQLQLKVHLRKGQACVTCNHLIEKIKVAQRGTYVCQHCQKELKLV